MFLDDTRPEKASHDMPSSNHSLAEISDLVTPDSMVYAIGKDAAKKAAFNVQQILVRSFLCTPFLAYAVALVALLISQGIPSAVAGLLFPVGYVMLSILGLEMATGSFSVMPIGVQARIVSWYALVRNWIWTFAGNLMGGAFFAWLLWFSLTKGGLVEPSGLLTVIGHLAEKKISYHHYGVNGWVAAVGMGILCNWLVSLGPIMAKATHTMAGKILIIWLPIATFYAIGFEHAVVNLFVFPLAILVGAEVSVYDWWVWNQIPVTIGNIIGAVLFNSVLWARTHSTKAMA
jgi:formate transporter